MKRVRPHNKAKIKERVRCKACLWVWIPRTGYIEEPCPQCGKVKDVRARSTKMTDHGRASIKRWIAANPDHSTRATRRHRQSALLLVGGGTIACVRCRCDRPELIEINHKTGGGGKEARLKKSAQFYREIVQLRRQTDDLELLCKPCNAVHALELQYGPLPFKVGWER